GARAANGVIVITTKKGHAGSTKVSYKGTFSAKSKPTTKDLNMATSAEALDGFEQLYNSMSMYYMPGYANYISAGYYWWMRDNGMMSADEANAAVEAMRKNDYFGEVDKYLFRPELTHQHNINISGGNEMNTFNVAANYQGTRGNFVFAGNRRITVDMRDDLRLNKVVSLSLGMNLNYATSHTPVYNPVYGGMEYASGKLFDFSELVSVFNPNMSFFEEDGTPKSVDMIVPMIKQNYSYISGLKSTELNLWEDLQQSTYSTQDFQSRINGTVNLFLARGLTANIGGNWQRGNYLCRQYYQAESFYARRVYNSGISLLNTDDRIYPDGGIVNEKRNNNQSWTVRGQVNFDRDFGGGKHKVTAIAGGEIRRTTYDNTILPTRYGYNEIAGTFSPVDTYGILAGDYMGTTLASMYGVMYMSMGETPTNGSIALMDNRYVSYYANGSYELNDKYLVSGSVRMDLTNFFGTDPKYRYRPIWSVGGTWKISKEDFFDVSWVDRLYLRGSYGINGNIALNEGPFLILG
ncbi:MAG: hypothetical protein HUJ93_05560, partial [Bacteroidales bacterium]|nr:hypothetical protein [Bacteroidales bacterium]